MAAQQQAQLVKLLRDEVRRQNVNACAGLLRRLVSDNTNATATLRENASVVTSAIELGLNAVTNPATSVALPSPTSISIMANISAAVDQWRDALAFVDPSKVAQSLAVTPSPVFLAKLMNSRNANPVADWCDAKGVAFCVPTAIARIGVMGGEWDVALRLALRYEASGERYSAGVLVPLLANGGQWELAVKVFRDAVAQGNMLDLTLIESILRTTASCGHWQASLAILGDLDRYMVTSELASRPSMRDTYQHVLNACPSWEQSLAVLEMVKKTTLKPPTEKMIAAAISTADRCGHVETATQLFDYARDHGIIEHLPASTKEVLVRNFRASAQWERALEALQWMVKADDASAKEGLIATIELHEQSGHWEGALKAADDVLAMGSTQDAADGGDTSLATSSGIPPHAYMSLLNACVAGRRWDKALRYYGLMLSDVGIPMAPPMALCLVLRSCLDAGRNDEALGLYRRVEAMGPAVVVPPAAHRLALMAAVNGGKWEDSLLLISTMNKSGLPHDAQIQRYGLWAAALTGSWRTSLSIYNKLPPQVVTRRDRELVRLSAHKAGPVAQAIVKQLSGVPTGKKR